MIVFLIPVRHEAGVNDYDKIWRLLNYTLTSIAAQDCPDWHVVVCANTVLPIWGSLPSHKITFLEQKRDFLGRTLNAWNFHDFREHLRDKAYRRRCGVVYALEHLRPTWYFMADADDYVSSDLVSTILDTTEPRHLVTTVNCGLIVNAGKNLYSVTDDFNTMCGTSIAIRTRLVHQSLSSPLDIGICLGQHKYERYFTDLCQQNEHHTLEHIPRAAYLQHEQNHGRKIWNYTKQMDAAMPITDEIRTKFSIPRTLGLTKDHPVLE